MLSESENRLKIGWYLTSHWAKNRRKSANYACFGIKTPFFDILECGGTIETGGWVGNRDEEWLADTRMQKWSRFEIGRNTKLDRCKNYLTLKSKKRRAEHTTHKTDNDNQKINNNNNKFIKKHNNGDSSVATAGPFRGRTLPQGSTETLLQYTMRPSIIHPNQCIYDVKTGSEFLTYSKNCAS